MQRDVRDGYQNITSEWGKRQKWNSFFCGCGTFSKWGLNGRKNSQKDPEILVHLGAHWVLEAPVEQREEFLHLRWHWHPKGQGQPGCAHVPNPPEKLHPAPDQQLPKAHLAFYSTSPWNSLYPSGTGQLPGTHQKQKLPQNWSFPLFTRLLCLEFTPEPASPGWGKDKNPTRSMICRTPRPSAWHSRRIWGLGWVCNTQGIQ